MGTLHSAPEPSLTDQGETKRRPIHLSYSVLTGLESALAGIGETISLLDWWLSTVSGFREALHPSAQANFERILSSGSKALAFVGSQAVPALANLLLSRRKYGPQCRQKSCLSCGTPLYHPPRLSSPPHSWIRHSTRLVQPPTMPSSTRPCTLPVFRSHQHRATTPPTIRRTHQKALH